MKPCLPWLFGALCILSLVACSGGASADFSSAPPAGTLDTTFDPAQNGRVIKDLGSTSDSSARVVVQPDGKIVVAATGGDDATALDFILLRYHPDGSLDTSFGSGGEVVIDFNNGDDIPTGLALQADGKIVVSGYSEASQSEADFAIARCNANGSLDTTFSSDGKTITTFGTSTLDKAQSCAIQPDDGKIVMVGSSKNGASHATIALARYMGNGTLDTAFGTDGLLTTDAGNMLRVGSNNPSDASDVAIQGKKIIISGNVANGLFVAARYDIGGGSLDKSFGQNVPGIAEGPWDPDVSQYAYAVAVQSDGSVLVGGSMRDSKKDYFFQLVRFTSKGEMDQTFNGGSQVATYFGPAEAAVQDLLLTADSKILAVGYAQDSAYFWDFTLARYHSDGRLDTTFGTGGIVMIPMRSTLNSFATSAALQADRKIVVAGEVEMGKNDFDIGLLRVWP